MARRLSIVLGRHGQVADIRSGAVGVEGVDLDFVDVKRMPDAYREMVRSQPYDICELAPTTYLMALAAGAPITALPIPMTRRFRHKGLLRRKDGPVATPKDLEGRRVGVRSYAVTAAVWTRGVLADDYGVDLGRVTWVVQEDENVVGYRPPANVERAGAGETIAALMRAGRLAAAFEGLAGLGSERDEDLTELVEDAGAREAAWYERTRIYPVHGVIALRNDIIRDNPGIAMRLFRAFSAAKENYWARVKGGAAADPEDARYLKLAALVGDPLPYGLEENRATFEALLRYARDQGLIATAPPVLSAFPDPRVAGAPAFAGWGG